MDNAIVSAIVVTFNSSEHINKSLAALKREIGSVGGEIIVFDNCSQDQTIDQIEKNFPNINLIKSKKNIGFGPAVNQAARQASGRFILLANPDMVLDEGALEILLNTFDKFPDAAGVSGRMRNPDGSFQATCRKLPTMYNMFLSRGSALSRFFKNSDYTLGDFENCAPVPAVAGTCLLIKIDSFKEIGGFDERFFMFMEDTDLSMRLSQTGKKLYYNPAAGAIHYWGEGAKSSRFFRLYYHHQSVWKYYLKHFPNGFSLLIVPIILLINLIARLILGGENK